MRKVRMNADGRVQGVGFRFMTKMLADKMGVFGCVRNEYDGSVTIEAIADEKTMEDFIRKVKESPSPSGRVTTLTIEDDPLIKDRTSFDVTY